MLEGLGKELTDLLTDVLTNECPPALIEASESGWSSGLWATLEDLDLTSVGVSEEQGGPGGTLADAAAVIRLGARFAAPVPLGHTLLVAPWVRRTFDMPPVSGPVAVDLTGDLEASFDGDLLRVRGRVENVPYGRFVSSLILIAPVDGGEVALEIEGPSLEWEHAENMAGEPRDGAAIDLVSANVSRPVADVRSGVVDVAALATTWAMVGAMERVRDLTVSYTQGREQFGRPLASFQAVKQLAAVIVGEVSVAAAAAEEATALVMADGPSDFAIAAARVRAAQAVAPVSRHAHQLHGAIGYTREYPLHQFTRRLWSWREEGGTQWQWTRLAGERVLAGAPSDPLWQTIAV